MPSASDELRALMAKWFGVYENDHNARQFLLARGWTEAGGIWSKPTPSYNPSYYEVRVLLFLRDEWDYDFDKPLFQEA